MTAKLRNFICYAPAIFNAILTTHRPRNRATYTALYSNIQNNIQQTQKHMQSRFIAYICLRCELKFFQRPAVLSIYLQVFSFFFLQTVVGAPKSERNILDSKSRIKAAGGNNVPCLPTRSDGQIAAEPHSILDFKEVF